MITRLSTFICAVFCLAAAGGEAKKEADDRPEDIIRRVHESMSAADEQGFERLPAPKPGTWRAENDEFPQTVEMHRATPHVYPTTERYVIVLQPLEEPDEPHQKLLETLREFVEEYFQLPTRLAAPLDLKNSKKELKLERIVHVGRFKTRTRLDSEKILDDVLFPDLPKDAVICVGVTSSDLFAFGQGVLGLASTQARVAVCSTFKFLENPSSSENDTQRLKGIFRLFVHEIGHTLGMDHCVFYRCAMNGCNSTIEASSTPLHFCPVCREKLILNHAIDARKRLRALEAFYSKHGIHEEAAWIRRQIEIHGK